MAAFQKQAASDVVQEGLCAHAALERVHSYIKSAVMKTADNAGAWPYKPGQDEISTEATAWCTIALRDQVDFAKPAIERLLGTQNSDGGWSTAPHMGHSDWTSAPALLALRLAGADNKACDSAIRRALSFLFDSRTEFFPSLARLLLFVSQGKKGVSYARGWPWSANCFHWIEPTSYALISLQTPSLPKEEVYGEIIGHARDFITGNECKGGGWNHGNSFCLNVYLPAFIVTTAEALLALQNCPNQNAVNTGLDFLTSKERGERSAMEFAWSILALSAHGRPVRDLVDALSAHQNDDGSFGVHNLMVTALCALALDTVNNRNPLKIKT